MNKDIDPDSITPAQAAKLFMPKKRRKPKPFEPGKTRIYVAHPYGGLPKNKKHVELMIAKMKNKSKKLNYQFISPIHKFEKEYKNLPYLTGMALCFKLIDSCDVVIFPKKTFMESKGCCMEYGYATGRGKLVCFYDGWGNIV